MPVASPEKYLEMLETAKANSYAFPAFNISSSQTLNAVLAGLSDANSDGIIQVTTGGAAYLSGQRLKDMPTGAVAFVRFAREVAKKYPINVAFHTDHCPKQHLDDFLRPIMALSEEEVKAGRPAFFQSHMWDGSAIDLDENLEIAQELQKHTKALDAILEVEIGAVGGEEDGITGKADANLYTTLEDAVKTVEALGLGLDSEQGRVITALTFGNVHGVYKPGNVKLRPELLGEIQAGLAEKYGHGPKPLGLVFHGGSGSTPEEIALAVKNGVIKMNVDTDTQYAFTKPIAAHMFEHWDGVLKVDGEVGNKKFYDPRSWGKEGEEGMSKRVVEATQQLGSAGKTIG